MQFSNFRMAQFVFSAEYIRDPSLLLSCLQFSPVSLTVLEPWFLLMELAGIPHCSSSCHVPFADVGPFLFSRGCCAVRALAIAVQLSAEVLGTACGSAAVWRGSGCCLQEGVLHSRVGGSHRGELSCNCEQHQSCGWNVPQVAVCHWFIFRVDLGVFYSSAASTHLSESSVHYICAHLVPDHVNVDFVVVVEHFAVD